MGESSKYRNDAAGLISEICKCKDLHACEVCLKDFLNVLKSANQVSKDVYMKKLYSRLRGYQKAISDLENRPYGVAKKDHSVQVLLYNLLPEYTSYDKAVEDIESAIDYMTTNFRRGYKSSISQTNMEEILHKLEERYGFFSKVFKGRPQYYVILRNESENDRIIKLKSVHEGVADINIVTPYPQDKHPGVTREYFLLTKFVEELLMMLSDGKREVTESVRLEAYNQGWEIMSDDEEYEEEYGEEYEEKDEISIYADYLGFGLWADLFADEKTKMGSAFSEYIQALVELFNGVIDLYIQKMELV